MARLGKVSEDTQELFDRICSETGLHNFMDMRIFNTAKSKKLIDIKKCPPLGESVAEKTQVVCTIVYEKAFERLPEDTQSMLMRDALNNVVFDSEKDKITIGVPQIIVTAEGRAKWGDKLIDNAETALHVMAQIEEEEREEKERLKAEKAAKRKTK